MPNEKTEELDLSSLPDEKEAVSEETFKPAESPKKKGSAEKQAELKSNDVKELEEAEEAAKKQIENANDANDKAESPKEDRLHLKEVASIAKQTKADFDFASKKEVTKKAEAIKQIGEASKNLKPRPIDRDVQKNVSDKILAKDFAKTPEIPEGKLTDDDLKDDGDSPVEPTKADDGKKKARKSHEKVRMLVTSEVEFVSKDALKKAFAGAVGIKNGWYSAIVNGTPTVIDGTDNACIKAIATKIKALLPKGNKSKDSELYPCAYELLKTFGFGLVELGASIKKAPKAKSPSKKKSPERYTVVDKDVIGTVIYDSLTDLKKAYRLKGDGPFSVTINGGVAVISAETKAVDGDKRTKEFDELMKIAEDVCKPKTDKAWACFIDRSNDKIASLVTSIYKAAGIRLISL